MDSKYKLTVIVLDNPREEVALFLNGKLLQEYDDGFCNPHELISLRKLKDTLAETLNADVTEFTFEPINEDKWDWDEAYKAYLRERLRHRFVKSGLEAEEPIAGNDYSVTMQVIVNVDIDVKADSIEDANKKAKETLESTSIMNLDLHEIEGTSEVIHTQLNE
ncbi:MAG: hypothetical protein ACJAS1_001643 [Oleiphilaceae bacterium]|jgi:hypothetical protein